MNRNADATTTSNVDMKRVTHDARHRLTTLIRGRGESQLGLVTHALALECFEIHTLEVKDNVFFLKYVFLIVPLFFFVCFFDT